MFGAFKRSIPQISIFHSASSQPSQKALALLRAATSSGYPPSSSSGPLKFDLDVVDGPPTPDQLRTIRSYLPSASLGTFVSAHPSGGDAAGAQSEDALLKAVGSAPNAFKWPLVVDWDSGRASVGDVEGVKGILEEIRKKRDGES